MRRLSSTTLVKRRRKRKRKIGLFSTTWSINSSKHLKTRCSLFWRATSARSLAPSWVRIRTISLNTSYSREMVLSSMVLCNIWPTIPWLSLLLNSCKCKSSLRTEVTKRSASTTMTTATMMTTMKRLKRLNWLLINKRCKRSFLKKANKLFWLFWISSPLATRVIWKLRSTATQFLWNLLKTTTVLTF